MTVIKLVNDLISKEDIAFGDASTTWSRETHTGGAVSVHYVDDSIIPASVLGGYIDDHLHVQNTDTGTTNTTWALATGGTGATLSTTGLTAGRTFTLPDTSNQALVGATDLASIAASLGASTVGVQDAGGYFSTATVEAVLQETGATVASLVASTHNAGMKNGFKLGYSGTSAITISGGMWAHSGTTNQHVYTTSQITFTLGAAGSNGASSNLGASEVHYIYIDDSAVVSAATRLLTAAEFVNSTTAPAYSHAKVGWYSGSDRCIGAILTNAASQVSSFITFGKHYYRYATPVVEFTVAASGTTYAALNVSSSVPRFATMSRLQVWTGTTNAYNYYFDTSSTTVTPEAHIVAAQNESITMDIPTNTSQVIYWYADSAVDTVISICGYYTDEL
uniref:Uncharacterized protein n=1 Tax=viral metagenome TaxID=1070528 RepID=A0A6M3K095_9ZZZZ